MSDMLHAALPEFLAGLATAAVVAVLDVADRRIRDHLKDVLRTQLPVTARDRLAAVRLSLDVDFDVLRRLRTLSAEEREDVFYVYGRATAALDLGHLEEAERGAKRLDGLRRRHVG